MKLQKKLWALGTVLALFVALIGFFSPAATAATPPWEPDPQAVGTVTLYDSSGNVVTSGNNLSNAFAYAAASSNDPNRADTSVAYISYGFPKFGNPTGTWFVTSAFGPTDFPVTGAAAPAPIKALTTAVASAAVTGANNLSSAAGTGTFDTTAGYNNILQVRVGTAGADDPFNSAVYWTADILIDKTAGTWTQVYPTPVAGPTATTTTLAALPASPQNVGTSVVFTATVTPSAAGTVQFFDGAATLGTPKTVSSGKATVTTSALAAGSHSITAQFTPTTPASFSGSTSAPLNYTINALATPTTTSLSANPSSGITVGATTVLTASVLPNTAVGTVTFKDNGTALGSPVTVSAGQAVSPAQSFTVGTHPLIATFTPTSSADFASSTTTTPLSYLVNPVPATPTTTTFTVTQSSPQVFGTSLTFNASVSPNTAVGTVHFFDGTTDVGSAAVSSGNASTSVSTLPAGVRSLTAQFMPTSPANFGASTSTPAVSFTITPAASTVSLGVSPSTSAGLGQAVTITATVGPASVGGGTVQFKYLPGDVVIGSSPVSGTTAHITTSNLPVTTTGIEAVFTPSSANYSASPNASIDYAITPDDTALALSVTPSGGQAAVGTQETLTAAITPSSATGSVQFFDGASMLGSPVTVSSGTASLPTTLAVGAHTLTAMFVTSDPASFNSSPTSNSVAFTVLPPATTTTTTFAVTPGTSEPFGTDLTFTATVTPSAAGTVTFKEGTTVVGTAPAVVGDTTATATFSTVGLAGGTHGIIASFAPTAPLQFAASASASQDITITAISTATSLAVTPVGPVEQGAKVTLKATITPSAAAGVVTFFNGATSLGTATVTAGVATLVTSKIAIGDASLTATFNATHANDYTSSTSSPVSLSVAAPPVVGSVFNGGKSIASGGKVTQGSTLQLHATGFQPGETVKIYLHSAPILVGTVTAGPTGAVIANILIPADFALGAHTITLTGALGSAVFAIDVVAAGGGSTSDGGGLANTGVNVEYGFVVGLLLLVAGGVLIGGVRLRGRRTTE